MIQSTLPKPKEKYRVCNWKEYNECLKTRGALTIWLAEDLVSGWIYEGQRKRGGKMIYSELAIQTCLVIRKVYHLPLRQTQGMMKSIARLMSISWQIPDFSTLSRRAAGLKIPLAQVQAGFHLVLDSTGLKVYGEGEWKVRMHGWNKHRTWRKLHLGINRETQEIVMELLTPHTIDDAQAALTLMNANKTTIGSFTGDGGYDKSKLRKLLHKDKITAIIPPQHNALISDGSKEEIKSRDDDIGRIQEIGRTQWKQEILYHKRSRVEVAMFRYKTIIGNKLKSRKDENQQTEARLGCSILNKMASLGMPISKKVA
jgi:DDE family transposase